MKNHPASGSCSTACTAVHWIICLLLFLASLAAITGAYRALFAGNRMDFGSSTASLSLLALVVCLTLWSKWMCRCLCRCEK